LAKLEDWTIFDIFRNDHYAPFPITESPKEKMSKLCQEGKVADEINVNAMTDERKTIWSDNKRVAV
jgi:hypothetical protein